MKEVLSKSKKTKFLKVFRFSLIAFLFLVILGIFNFHRVSDFLPKKYKLFFERANDLIFGKVQVIEISGNQMISKDEILTFVYKQDVDSDDLILINSEAKITAALEQNPVVKSVKIKRFLPNKMVIFIKEKNLILRYFDENQKKFFTISSEGEVLDFNPKNLKLPLISGFYEIEDLIKLYNKIADKKIILANLTDIIPFFGYRFDIVLKRKIFVHLPEENLQKALEILEGLLLENNILNKNIKTIDLRIKDKIIIEYYQNGESQTYKPANLMKTFNWS